MKDLPVLLDRLEQAGGPSDPVPSADGWELVLAENIAYLVGDQRRWQALEALRTVVGLAPEQILAAPEDALRGVVTGARPAERAQRLRRCAELAVAGAPWRAYPGIGRPGPTALTCSQVSGPFWPWMLTACVCLPGWASATRHARTRPAIARLRSRLASSCPQRCPPASAPTSCCAVTGRSSAGVKTRPARFVPSAMTVPAPATRHPCTDAVPPVQVLGTPMPCSKVRPRPGRPARRSPPGGCGESRPGTN